MNEILFHYEKIDPTTWAYLASLLIIGLFFKFGRFWSVRNLDLLLAHPVGSRPVACFGRPEGPPRSDGSGCGGATSP